MADVHEPTFRSVMGNPLPHVETRQFQQKHADAVGRILEAARLGPLGFCYSGGKDSVVVQHLMRDAGITPATSLNVMYETDTGHLMPDACAEYIHRTAPEGTEFVRVMLSHAWFAADPRRMFTESKVSAKAFTPIISAFDRPKWRAQHAWYAKNKLAVVVMGRRTQENSVRSHLQTTSDWTISNPICDWRHEDVAAYIASNRLPLAPTYYMLGGIKNGCDSWVFFMPDFAAANLRPELTRHEQLLRKTGDWDAISAYWR